MLSGCPMTSTSAEDLFAMSRAHDVRAGASRDNTRAGVILANVDNTVVWVHARREDEAAWQRLRRITRKAMKVKNAGEAGGGGAGRAQVRATSLQRSAQSAPPSWPRRLASKTWLLPRASLSLSSWALRISKIS
eukprot:2654846-Pleurochrysis_carterae.AAC.1